MSKGAPKKPEHLKKIPVGIKIPAWMYEQLKEIAEKQERTQNSLIEEGLRKTLKKYRI